jgi:hypothetical protein
MGTLNGLHNPSAHKIAPLANSKIILTHLQIFTILNANFAMSVVSSVKIMQKIAPDAKDHKLQTVLHLRVLTLAFCI